MLIYACSGLVCIINCYCRNAFYHKMPCAVVIYLLNIGYIPNFLSCMGCIMYYLQQCYFSINSYNKAIDHNYIKEENFFYKLCMNFKEEKFVKFIMYSTIGGVLFSGIFGFTGQTYTYIPLTKGYCTNSNIEGYPFYFTIIVYFIFSIFALNELHKLGSDFVLRKSLMITLCIAIILLIINVFGNSTNYIKCATIIRYIPHETVLQIFSCIFNFSQITYPLFQLFYIKYQVKRLELTKSGLIHLLNDKTLFNEFLNFCNNKRCVEGVIFHREYKKFKNIFKDSGKKLASVGESINGTTSSNSDSYTINIDLLYQNISGLTKEPFPYYEYIPNFTLPTNQDQNNKYSYNLVLNNNETEQYPSPKHHKRMLSVNNKRKEYVNIYSDNNVNNNVNINQHLSNGHEQIHVNKKIIHIYDEIFEKANLIFNFFFTQYSDYELNLPNPIVRKIDYRLQLFNDHYAKMKNKQLFLYEELECEDIFDEAYEEVIQSLYLNTYSAFVIYKKRNK
ncbi:hypothetical protein BCR36DRAFT_358970 [Piromyces finnis]|uniref:RGS domain-containing protein n=1 Tax=Piromyces finnis TaxID=1754191 RepID=A0A1Y1V0W3_9FUNG|nr:hypothetical protein BCR36DRAFT_358970 [Piromyces finnis]|eukprot:ORX44805.1 hypothetical protein BCR36DRAFT_358970 [Piromyces finnis]